MIRPSGLSQGMYQAMLGLAFSVLLALGATPASAQADIATYQGPDRMQRLIEGAKKEGRLTIYTSATVDDMAVLTAAFEKKYGIKASVWRASSENIIQRA